MKNSLVALALLLLAGCVSVDPETGETLPRGNQKYKFETVERRAEKLQNGMAKFETLVLLGAPAKMSPDKSVWIYLPERPSVLVPGRALRLVFKDNVLVKHGYRPVVFGIRF